MWENCNDYKQRRQRGISVFLTLMKRSILSCFARQGTASGFFNILCKTLIHVLLLILQTIHNLKFTVTSSAEESIINIASFVVILNHQNSKNHICHKSLVFSFQFCFLFLLLYCFLFSFIFNLWPIFIPFFFFSPNLTDRHKFYQKHNLPYLYCKHCSWPAGVSNLVK